MKYLLILLPSIALSWGPIGHRVVGQLAENRLDAHIQKKVRKLLAGQTLPDVANWADQIRSDEKWRKASTWHYVSIADGKKYGDVAPNPAGDAVEAIERFTKQLKDVKSTREQKQEALKFLVHFIGDFHMPLHVGRAEDHGGNKIALKWFGKRTNLHSVWDEEIIEMEKLSYGEYAQFLERKFKGQNASGLELSLWISEAQELRPLVYALPTKYNQKDNWEYNYRYQVMDELNLQLYRAGTRLGLWLNRELKDVKVD